MFRCRSRDLLSSARESEGLTISANRFRARLAVTAVVAVAVGLGGCGRKGSLDPPPASIGPAPATVPPPDSLGPSPRPLSGDPSIVLVPEPTAYAPPTPPPTQGKLLGPGLSDTREIEPPRGPPPRPKKTFVLDWLIN
jgi:predicted small lipoprotein YifL